MSSTIEKVSVVLVQGTRPSGTCLLEFSPRHECWIQATLEDGLEFREEGQDLPSVLRQLRARLQELGADLACQGSRKDVRASSMSIESGGGRSLYRIRMGVPTRRSDVVDMFSESPVDTIATFQEQDDYYQAWLESIKPTSGERSEARLFPDGWIYRIDSRFDPAGEVPPYGIIGAWQVDAAGEIVGALKANDNYRPE